MIETENKALDYFKGNELAANVWKGKYALKKNGEIVENTPDEMHRRMAREFARIEENYGGVNRIHEGLIYDFFMDFSQIIPQGSVMSQLGNPNQIGSLSNCIVLPKIYDSYGGIHYTDQQLTQLMKRRCGVGIDISTLRPAGSKVSNAAQTSTGAVSFMHRFSNSTREVAQDGRRGALMISLDIRHPEAEQFATIKQDLSKITGANISLKITDDFMKAAEEDKLFDHRFPVDTHSIKVFDWPAPTEFRDGDVWKASSKSAVTYYMKSAKKTWDTIVSAAHKSAEPGLIFWDRQHWYSPSSVYPEFENVSTNPCSEIAMGNDSCRLIAINMFSCVAEPFTKKATFDFEHWYWLNYNGMRLMDDLVDLELEAIDRIRLKIQQDEEPQYIKDVEVLTWEQLAHSGERGRRTGLGFTALGDTLAALGLKYDSNEAIELVELIMKTKLAAELDSTIDMAEERGAFPAFDAALEAKYAEQENTFFFILKNEFPQQWERMQKVGRRNISWSTVAPTGSLSLLTQLDKDHFGSTSGIEPLFAVYYIRRKKINPNDKEARVDFVDQSGDKWQEFPVFHEGFKMWYDIAKPQIAGINVDNEGNMFPLEELTKTEIIDVIANSPYAGSTAPEIDWQKRVQMQGVIQKYITHSISSTINLPESVSVEEVSNIYFEAWKQGLKGITVYRDGSRSGVLITEPSKKEEEFHYHDAPKRPKDLKAELTNVTVKGVKYSVIVGFLNDKPYEVFAFQYGNGTYSNHLKGKITKTGKGEYNFISDSDELAAINIGEAAIHADEQMLTRLVSGMMRHGVNPKFIIEQIDKCPLEVVSFGKALARVVKRYIPEKELLERYKCKECGSSNIIFEEGCGRCTECGSSKCS
jgi:ribonucleoside-diphosphate reductase alpha chain